MIPIVIDTNIFFSAIYNPKGLEREILDLSIEKEEIQLFAPDIFWEEIKRNFIKKLGYSEEIINELFSKFNIIKVPLIEYEDMIKRAEKLVDHKEDVYFIAVSLYLNCPLWSGNKRHFKHLENIEEIIWFTSSNLISYLTEKGLIEANKKR